MAPFARDLGYDGPPFAWDEDRRAQLRAELDAWYARAYGLTRDELRYILDPADVKGPDYPSETFRVLKKNEIARFGEYRTARLVLQAWDRWSDGELALMQRCQRTPCTPNDRARKTRPALSCAPRRRRRHGTTAIRLERGIEGGWLHYASTTAPGSIWIAGASLRGPWLLSIDHSGVVAEIGATAGVARSGSRASRPSSSRR